MLSSRSQMANALRALQKYTHQPKPPEPASISAFKISGSGGWRTRSRPPLEKRIERLESGDLAEPGF